MARYLVKDVNGVVTDIIEFNSELPKMVWERSDELAEVGLTVQEYAEKLRREQLKEILKSGVKPGTVLKIL